MEGFAPLAFQEDWDNSGFQVGSAESDITGVLVCLDVTEAVLDEAVEKGCNMVVSHHPLIFAPLKHLTGGSYVERCVARAIIDGIGIYSAHTSLDNAPGGVNHKIAELIGLQDVCFLAPEASGESGSGIIGTLPSPVPADEFLDMLKRVFGVECLQHSVPVKPLVEKVALCGGAGSFLLGKAAKAGADCFITGDMSYHNFFGLEDGPLTIAMGHYQSEQYTIDLIADRLSEAFKDLRVVKTATCTNPIVYR